MLGSRYKINHSQLACGYGVVVAVFIPFNATVEVGGRVLSVSPFLSREPTPSWREADLKQRETKPRSRMTGPPEGRVSGGVSCHGRANRGVLSF